MARVKVNTLPLIEFLGRLDLRAKEIRDNDWVRGLVSKTGATLVNTTPFRQGFAKSNWYISKEFPSLESQKGSTDGEIKSINNAPEGNFKVLWITNNLPYINRLNMGWSAQQPEGFVQRAIDTALRAQRREKVFKNKKGNV